jgi:hypothetical protein
VIAAPPVEAGTDHDTVTEPSPAEADTPLGALGGVTTMTGTLEAAVLFLPNSPLLPVPQQYAVPSESRAQVCALPALIAVRVLPDNTPEVSTATGTLESEVEFLPNLPPAPCPQQYALPAESKAHVWKLPFVIATRVLPDNTPEVSTDTGDRTVPEATPPSPS